MVKNKVGGITTRAGITFVGQHNKATIRSKDGSFLVKPYFNPSANATSNVPLVRGFFKLLNVIKFASGTTIGKISLGFVLISIISFFLGLLLGESVPSFDTELVDIILSILTFVIIIGTLGYIISIRNLHGLEHKIINAYNNGLELTIDNVKQQPKETPKCGGTLLGIFILIELVWIGLFKLPPIYLCVLFPVLGYEAFMHASGDKWYNKVLYFPGLIVQKVTTGNKNSDEIIKNNILGFKALIAQEDSI